MKAVVFDTGEHGVGGRAATRTTADTSIHSDWLSSSNSSTLRSAGLLFDNAAQCFTATDAAFQQQCEAWVAAGAARRWQGPVGTLKQGGSFEPLNPGVAVYVASGGMRQLAEHMAEEVRHAVLYCMVLCNSSNEATRLHPAVPVGEVAMAWCILVQDCQCINSI